MASPRWSRSEETPVAAAIAAAVHAAWDGPEEGASNRFTEALRKMLPPAVYARVEFTALRTFQLQPRPPKGLELPPEWAWFEICPRCVKVRSTPHTRPQNGRLKLQVLRDRDWISAQFEKRRSCVAIARSLECSPELVRYWANKHGLTPPKTMVAREFDARVATMHRAGEGPGAIAHALDTTVDRVRISLRRQGLANRKSGHVYFKREWWASRLEAGKTKFDCSKEAGIKPHAATYFINKFGLDAYTKRNAKRGKRLRYPQLHDRVELYRLLVKHDGKYEAVAAAIGCAPTTVSKYARELLGLDAKWKPVPHGKREWWEKRLAAGRTTWEMAEEAGIREKTARERLREFGLLNEAYRVNTRRELARRRAPA